MEQPDKPGKQALHYPGQLMCVCREIMGKNDHLWQVAPMFCECRGRGNALLPHEGNFGSDADIISNSNIDL